MPQIAMKTKQPIFLFTNSRKTPSYLQYQGTLWDNRELKLLERLVAQGGTPKQVAKMLGRTEAACKLRYREIRRMRCFLEGKKDDSLQTWGHRWKG